MKTKSDGERSWSKLLSSTLPIVRWLPQYQRSWLRSDMVAGLTLAAYAIPVSVAYASLAGLPPQAGLYCYLLGGVAYAAFGTSRHLAIGPTSAISILIGSALGTLSAGDALRHTNLAAAVAVLAGFIGIIAWALRLGNIANFVSETVLSGFKVGAGLVIASTQLPKLFGISDGGSNFFSRMIEVIRNLRDTNLVTLGVGLGGANLVAGVGQGYPLAGGMSQSAVNEKGGAQTPMALVVASGGIGVVLLFLTGLMHNLPEPVLAAVVLVAVGGLIRPRELRHLYRVSNMEFRVAMVATLGVLGFGILKGVLLAAIFSILLLLKRASHPRIALLGRLPGTNRFADLSRYIESETIPRVVMLRVEAGLFYFNAQNVKKEVLERVHQHGAVELVVIDLSTSANIDLAGVRMLSELKKEVAQAGASLALAAVHGDVRDLLQAEGLEARIPGIAQRMRIAALIEQRKRVLRAAS